MASSPHKDGGVGSGVRTLVPGELDPDVIGPSDGGRRTPSRSVSDMVGLCRRGFNGRNPLQVSWPWLPFPDLLIQVDRPKWDPPFPFFGDLRCLRRCRQSRAKVRDRPGGEGGGG